ncbi:hypothetical protein BDZ97DRAFT_1598320, partial [Flammula alnicola]
ADGRIVCPACKERIKCGPGGWKNVQKTHLGKKTCLDSQQKKDKNKGLKNGSILSMFSRLKSKPTPVPSTTQAPAPLPSNPAPRDTVGKSPCHSSVDMTSTLSREHSIEIVGSSVKAVEIADDPADVPDPLACFDVDPAGYDNKMFSPEELWEEVLNGAMKNGLGWGTTLDVPSLRETDGCGMMGLTYFVEYFV